MDKITFVDFLEEAYNQSMKQNIDKSFFKKIGRRLAEFSHDLQNMEFEEIGKKIRQADLIKLFKQHVTENEHKSTLVFVVSSADKKPSIFVIDRDKSGYVIMVEGDKKLDSFGMFDTKKGFEKLSSIIPLTNQTAAYFAIIPLDKRVEFIRKMTDRKIKNRKSDEYGDLKRQYGIEESLSEGFDKSTIEGIDKKYLQRVGRALSFVGYDLQNIKFEHVEHKLTYKDIVKLYKEDKADSKRHLVLLSANEEKQPSFMFVTIDESLVVMMENGKRAATEVKDITSKDAAKQIDDVIDFDRQKQYWYAFVDNSKVYDYMYMKYERLKKNNRKMSDDQYLQD